MNLSTQAHMEMRKAPRTLLSADELYHLLNSKPLRSDGRYIENCIGQNFGECDKQGEPMNPKNGKTTKDLAKIEAVKLMAVKFWAVAMLAGCALLFCLAFGEICQTWGM